MRLTSGPRAVTLRVPLPERLPYRVEEGDRSLTLRIYGGASDVNWMQYGETDSLVRRMSYRQETADELIRRLVRAEPPVDTSAMPRAANAPANGTSPTLS